MAWFARHCNDGSSYPDRCMQPPMGLGLAMAALFLPPSRHAADSRNREAAYDSGRSSAPNCAREPDAWWRRRMPVVQVGPKREWCSATIRLQRPCGALFVEEPRARNNAARGSGVDRGSTNLGAPGHGPMRISSGMCRRKATLLSSRAPPGGARVRPSRVARQLVAAPKSAVNARQCDAARLRARPATTATARPPPPAVPAHLCPDMQKAALHDVLAAGRSARAALQVRGLTLSTAKRGWHLAPRYNEQPRALARLHLLKLLALPGPAARPAMPSRTRRPRAASLIASKPSEKLVRGPLCAAPRCHTSSHPLTIIPLPSCEILTLPTASRLLPLSPCPA